MITPLGALTVGAAVPGCVSAVVSGSVGINLALPDIQARLSALLDFSPTPVSFELQKTLALQTLASIELAITGGIPVPDISAQIAEVAALVSQLTASVVAINAQLTTLAAFEAPLQQSGVAAYAYDGVQDDLPGELAAALAPNPAHVNALVLIATNPAAWSAMGAILKVSA